MPDILDVLFKGWKKMLLLIIAATGLVVVISFFLPDEYLSTATSLPASSVNSDKARIFNDNIQALYSDIGTSDELDRIIGTATLDTIYISLARKFNLAQYYKVKEIKEAIYSAAFRLKKNARIYKSAYGELKVEVWDADKNTAALLANALTDELQNIHQSLQNESNALLLKKLKEDYIAQEGIYLQTSDSLNKTSGAVHDILTDQKTAQAAQLQQYQKLIAQYGLMVNTHPQVLLKVEEARPALKPGRPERLKMAVVTLFAAALFSFLALLFMESRKNYAATNS